MKRLESDFQWKGRGAGKGAEQIEGSKERFRPRVFEIKFSAGEIVFRVFVYFAHRVFPRRGILFSSLLRAYYDYGEINARSYSAKERSWHDNVRTSLAWNAVLANVSVCYCNWNKLKEFP